MFIKAGFPYPDPTPEMMRKWMFYHNFGKLTMPFRTALIIVGIIFKVFSN